MVDQTKVIGAERLNATLRAASRDLGRMDEASARAAGLVAADTRSKAPKRSGRLARSVSSHQQQVVVTAPYGVFVEFGTKFTAAQPFLRPAVGAQIGPVLDVYTDEAQRIINQVEGA